MERLENKLVEYPWGSRTALAELRGEPSPSPRPQAEMWMGAHPAAPSVVAGPSRTTLAARIAAAPAAELGEHVARRFEGRLPFLLKVLAAESPLSMQAHPSPAQAREGYAREEAAGVPWTAPERRYKDPSHKPEILCALGPFEALSGFRPAAESLALVESLGAPALRPVIEALRQRPGGEGIRAAFEHLMTLPAATRPAFLQNVLGACREALGRLEHFREEIRWALALADLYPGDMGAVSSLLLNLVRLEAGEAMYLPAGNLHSYLKGVGIELMASSDNVLRGGLTPKHVDVDELLRVLDFRDEPFTRVAVRKVDAHETEYLTPTPDFRLSMLRVAAGAVCRPARRGPDILLCIEGHTTVATDGASLVVERGSSVFVPASDGSYTLRGEATVVRATVGDLD